MQYLSRCSGRESFAARDDTFTEIAKRDIVCAGNHDICEARDFLKLLSTFPALQSDYCTPYYIIVQKLRFDLIY